MCSTSHSGNPIESTNACSVSIPFAIVSTTNLPSRATPARLFFFRGFGGAAGTLRTAAAASANAATETSSTAR